MQEELKQTFLAEYNFPCLLTDQMSSQYHNHQCSYITERGGGFSHITNKHHEKIVCGWPSHVFSSAQVSVSQLNNSVPPNLFPHQRVCHKQGHPDPLSSFPVVSPSPPACSQDLVSFLDNLPRIIIYSSICVLIKVLLLLQNICTLNLAASGKEKDIPNN